MTFQIIFYLATLSAGIGLGYEIARHVDRVRTERRDRKLGDVLKPKQFSALRSQRL